MPFSHSLFSFFLSSPVFSLSHHSLCPTLPHPSLSFSLSSFIRSVPHSLSLFLSFLCPCLFLSLSSPLPSSSKSLSYASTVIRRMVDLSYRNRRRSVRERRNPFVQHDNLASVPTASDPASAADLRLIKHCWFQPRFLNIIPRRPFAAWKSARGDILKTETTRVGQPFSFPFSQRTVPQPLRAASPPRAPPRSLGPRSPGAGPPWSRPVHMFK